MGTAKDDDKSQKDKPSESDARDSVSKVLKSSDVSATHAPANPEKGDDRNEPRKTVALTLGSGGARGYAHIGAIEILVERGYDIVAISGCSMGALVGGMFGAGKMQDYKDWVTGLGQFDVLKLLDVTFNSVGAIRGEKFFRWSGKCWVTPGSKTCQLPSPPWPLICSPIKKSGFRRAAGSGNPCLGGYSKRCYSAGSQWPGSG